MLETGFDNSYELNAFQQLAGAYQINLISVDHDYRTFQEGLDAAVGTKVFMTPPGRIAWSTEFSDWVKPEGDIVFCFGSPQNSMVPYITESDIALHITTPFRADMMAISVAGIVMYVHR